MRDVYTKCNTPQLIFCPVTSIAKNDYFMHMELSRVKKKLHSQVPLLYDVLFGQMEGYINSKCYLANFYGLDYFEAILIWI